MKRTFLVWLLVAAAAQGVEDRSRTAAMHLAKLARQAQSSGQTVRAFLLFSEAVARDPGNATYRANRDALAPAAKLLSQAKIQSADVKSDIFTAEYQASHPDPPIERISVSAWQAEGAAAPVPRVLATDGKRDFDLRVDARHLVEQVGTQYGLHVLVDKDLPAGNPIHFELQGADCRTALEAVTAATHTFVFATSPTVVYFATDTEAKRNELEPVVLLTFPLGEALSEKELIDAANAVRGLLNLRTIGWDSASRMVAIRDRATRAETARALMETLLLPPAQVSFEVEFLAVDTDSMYHYGTTLQTMFQFIDFGHIGGLKSVLPAALGSTQFLTFGAGASLFGVGVANAQVFATYSHSVSQAIFDATVVVGDRQTANFHIGDKYPIATSLYSGFNQGEASIYNPAPQVNLEDLGLLLKLTPHVTGEGEVGIDVEAAYKTLGTQTFNTVPSIAERSFKGSVNVHEGEWAILAGIDASSTSITRSGLLGVSQIPGLKQFLSENTRDKNTSNLLLVIKPTITRLPMTNTISPQFLLGSRRGPRVLM